MYYVCIMSLKDITDRIKIGEEIYGKRLLENMLQRVLSKRAPEIAEYLLTSKQRFFNALVAAVYKGEPAWYEIDLKGNAQFSSETIPQSVRESVGLLHLTGEEKVFALDGQHRLKGIAEAVQAKPTLATEELTVIFVGHKETKAGKQRSRRLFSTLNRYAKPVTLGEIIILDEDDAMAITTRALVRDHVVLSAKDVILIAKQKTIPHSNRKSLTTVQTLYEVLRILFFPDTPAGRKEAKKAKKRRPSNQKLDEYYSTAVTFWDSVIAAIPALQALPATETNPRPAEAYRHARGGHLLFRPVGLLALARAVRRARDAGWLLSRIVNALARVQMELSQAPWNELLWNSQSHTMITNKENQRIASLLLLHMAHVPLEAVGSSTTQLHHEYAAVLQKPVADVQLP